MVIKSYVRYNIRVPELESELGKTQPEMMKNFDKLPFLFKKIRHEAWDFVTEEIDSNINGVINVEYFWFFEPYLQTDYIVTRYFEREGDINKESFLQAISDIRSELEVILREKFQKDIKVELVYNYDISENGLKPDWFCESEKEMLAGYKRYVECSEISDIFLENIKEIEEGKGLDAQIGRTIHPICNNLGINYSREAKICFKRGLICWLFSKFSFQRAVWIYTKIFRQKY